MALISPWEIENAELPGHLASIQGAPAMCHSVIGSENRARGRKEAPDVPGAYLRTGERTDQIKKINHNIYSFTNVNTLFILHQELSEALGQINRAAPFNLCDDLLCWPF